jgi:mono/diheme cytochrome c family protein
MKLFKLALIFSVLTFFIVACTQTQAPTKNTAENTNKETNAAPETTATPDELASGRKNYKEQCARCHQDDGTGGKVEIEGKTLKVDNLTTDKMKKMADEKYIKYMVNGIPDEGMPAFKDVLSDEEMKEVVKFIREEIQK